MITYAIIGITTIVSVVCFSQRDLLWKLSLNPHQIYHHKSNYQVFSHVLVHAGWMHLLFNMLTLYFFGTLVEHVYDSAFAGIKGSALFLLLYVGGGVVSAAYTIIKHRNDLNYIAVGASGAVSSILFAFILFEPTQPLYMFMLPIPIPSVIFGVLYLVISFYLARRNNDNIGHDAHIGGALFGFVFTILCNPLFLSHFIFKITHWW